MFQEDKKVMVMNNATWEMMMDKLVEDASKTIRPIEHLDRYRDIEIIIDESLPFNHIEVYENKEQYENVLKYGKRSDTDAGDVG